MTYFKLIKGDIDSELILDVNTFLNYHDATVQKFIIGLNSEGGSSYDARFLLNTLNHSSIVNRCTLVCMDKVFSAAFDVFYKFKGKKQIMLGSRGMIHHDSMLIRKISREKLLQDNEIETSLVQLDILAKETIECCSSFLDFDELSKLSSGEDIYFDFYRMLKIFPNIEVV